MSLKFFPTIILTGAELSAGISSDFKNGTKVPALKSPTNFLTESTVKLESYPSQVNFLILSAGSKSLRVGRAASSTPMNSANLY